MNHSTNCVCQNCMRWFNTVRFSGICNKCGQPIDKMHGLDDKGLVRDCPSNKKVA